MNRFESPTAIPEAIVCLVSWSIPITLMSSSVPLTKATVRCLCGVAARPSCAVTTSALDRADDERPQEIEDDDRDHRREVEHPDRWDQTPEQAQVWLADVAQKAQDRI